MEKATFGAGCFWHVEEAFCHLKGVTSTAAGYMGGRLENPSYGDVHTGETGHAEVVQVEYETSQVSYEDLLEVFWRNHNPTTRNRQGPDVGSQYRSAIFYHDEKQKALAEGSKEKLEKSANYKSPIVTEITRASMFWRAEEYHQKYLEKHGLSSCNF